MNNQNYNYCPNNLPTHYHLGLRNHENFSAPGFQQPIAEKKPLLEDLLMIDSCVKEFTGDVLHSDPLEHCLLNSSSMMDFGEEFYAKDDGVVDYVLALEAYLLRILRPSR
ncbi:hypothetical protein TIFTF001_027853 [Ficus carica]|uniref:Uncharacterized protein n=1 Tax=Ficus carica TaxID=3494 RepID=A0AA88IZ83_FICCA|nr:hypothetical protein TIFTF001_027853 [Ficus carica]